MVERHGTLDRAAYRRWVAGYDPDTGVAKGQLRQGPHALRLVELGINGPKTWSIAAALHSDIAAAYDNAQHRAALAVLVWLAERVTTRVGPQGHQVEVPVEHLEAVLIRGETSRAGDPHRHLRVQVNARVFAHGAWRGLHTSRLGHEAKFINEIGHNAMIADPEFRRAIESHGYVLDDIAEIQQLTPCTQSVNQRRAQILRYLNQVGV